MLFKANSRSPVSIKRGGASTAGRAWAEAPACSHLHSSSPGRREPCEHAGAPMRGQRARDSLFLSTLLKRPKPFSDVRTLLLRASPHPTVISIPPRARAVCQCSVEGVPSPSRYFYIARYHRPRRTVPWRGTVTCIPPRARAVAACVAENCC